MNSRRLILIFATALTLYAQADVTLQRAMRKETLEGDLKGAIALYEKAVTESKSDRTTAAKALIRMAECHQKLGDFESQKIYERVLREYGDQKEAVATARGKLGGTEMKSAGIVARQVWTGPKVFFGGTVSPDGRFLSYTDWDANELALHDFVTGTDRVVTKKDASQSPEDYPEESAISRDGKRIAAMWYSDSQGRYDLRLVDLSSSGPVTPRVLVNDEEVVWISPYDWSPDGAWIAVQVQRKDRTTQIGLVSAAGGPVRVLKSVDWRGASKLLFSPDGKYLAYDLPAGENTDQRDIFLLAADASKETVLSQHPADETVLAWTPDGKHLLFTSDRSGANGIWAMAVNNGKAQDAPVLIRPDIGNAHALGLSRSGTLYLAQGLGGPEIYVASVEFQTGKLLSDTEKPIRQFVGANSHPVFSPDGKYLAYESARDRSPSTSRPKSRVLVILSLETGRVRDLRPDLSQFDRLEWAPDSRSVAVRGEDNKGRHGIFRIDTQTGAVSPLVLKPGVWTPLWSPDGKKLYYQRLDKVTAAIVSLDIASGAEREILQAKFLAPRLSPDGRQFAMYAEGRKSLMVVPVEGGTPREIVDLAKIGSFTGVKLDWTADGQSVIAPQWSVSRGPEQELWRIPVSGGSPQRIELNPAPMVGGFSIHPDGRRIAYTSGRVKREVWVIESFLPLLQAKR